MPHLPTAITFYLQNYKGESSLNAVLSFGVHQSEHKAKCPAEGTMTMWHQWFSPQCWGRVLQCRTDGQSPAGWVSLPATQTEQHPDRLAEICLHKVTSIHINPAFLFRKVNISACYSQPSSIQHALCKRCVHMDTR